MASIALDPGAHPTGLAAVENSLWVASKGSNMLFQVDPATNRIGQTVNIGQDSGGQPLDVFGDLLTMPCRSSTSSVVVDGSSGFLRGTIPDAAGMNAATAAGSVWISNYSGTALKRIDPKSLKVQKVFRVASGMVSFDGKFIWSASSDVNSYADGRLAKIDPATNRVIARYRVSPMHGPFMTYGLEALWFKPIDKRTIHRFGTSTGRITTSRLDNWQPLSEFADTPIAAGAGSLWLRLNNTEIVRIDPTTKQVSGHYPADPAGGGGFPLIAFDSLWTANYASDSVWRMAIRPSG